VLRAARTPIVEAPPAAEEAAGDSKPEQRGHRRIPVSRVAGAERVMCADPQLQPDSACPACFGHGRLDDTGEPSILINRMAQPAVSARPLVAA
jgi:hypothetical protein